MHPITPTSAEHDHPDPVAQATCSEMPILDAESVGRATPSFGVAFVFLPPSAPIHRAGIGVQLLCGGASFGMGGVEGLGRSRGHDTIVAPRPRPFVGFKDVAVHLAPLDRAGEEFLAVADQEGAAERPADGFGFDDLTGFSHEG